MVGRDEFPDPERWMDNWLEEQGNIRKFLEVKSGIPLPASYEYEPVRFHLGSRLFLSRFAAFSSAVYSG